MKKRLAIIGGLDPTGHAGVLADAGVLEELNLPYFTVVTAVTAQTDQRFLGWEACSVKLFRQQLQACGKKIWGVKIGMIGDTRLIDPLVQWLDRIKPRQVIWDPVFQSSSGGKLISAKSWNRPLETLLSRVTLWTPNIPEAEWILGPSVKSVREMEAALRRLHALNPNRYHWTLLKGGHLPKKEKRIHDLLTHGTKIYRYACPRLAKHPRGTGCFLASAWLGFLARNNPPIKAFSLARNRLKKSKF